MPIGFLTGERSLRRQRDRAIDYADNLYGGRAAALEPIRALGTEMGTQGMGEARRSGIRQAAISEFTAPADMGVFGGSGARAIAGTQQRDIAGRSGMAQTEREIGIADEDIRLRGRQQAAEAQADMRENIAMRDAAIEEARMNFEAERSARRQQLLGTAMGAAFTFAPDIFSTLRPDSGPLRPREYIERFTDTVLGDEMDWDGLPELRTDYFFDTDLDLGPAPELDTSRIQETTSPQFNTSIGHEFDEIGQIFEDEIPEQEQQKSSLMRDWARLWRVRNPFPEGSFTGNYQGSPAEAWGETTRNVLNHQGQFLSEYADVTGRTWGELTRRGRNVGRGIRDNVALPFIEGFRQGNR